MLEENVRGPQVVLHFILEVLYATNFNMIQSVTVKTMVTVVENVMVHSLESSKSDNLRYFSLDQYGGLTDIAILTATSLAQFLFFLFFFKDFSSDVNINKKNGTSHSSSLTAAFKG